MTRRLTIEEVIDLHARVVVQSGGAAGLRDAGALASDEFAAWVRMRFGERGALAP